MNAAICTHPRACGGFQSWRGLPCHGLEVQGRSLPSTKVAVMNSVALETENRMCEGLCHSGHGGNNCQQISVEDSLSECHPSFFGLTPVNLFHALPRSSPRCSQVVARELTFMDVYLEVHLSLVIRVCRHVCTCACVPVYMCVCGFGCFFFFWGGGVRVFM